MTIWALRLNRDPKHSDARCIICGRPTDHFISWNLQEPRIAVEMARVYPGKRPVWKARWCSVCALASESEVREILARRGAAPPDNFELLEPEERAEIVRRSVRRCEHITGLGNGVPS